MTTTINTYACIIKATDYVDDTDDLISMSRADGMFMLGILYERGVKIECASRGTKCFSMDNVRFAMDITEKYAVLRKMEEVDFEAILLNEMLCEAE